MIKSTQARRAALAHYGEVARLGKVLASPVRLQLLDLLRQGSRSVEDLAAAAGVTVANSSRHLQQMRAARVVTTSREGRHVRYRIADEGVSRAFGVLRGLAETLLPEMDRLRHELGTLEPAEREALLARIRRGDVTLLDVRPEEEYRQAHLPGARSIPLPELPRRLGEVARDREVVAYCRGPFCPLAREAVEVLVAAGYRARHLDLGVPDLRERGLPVESGADAAATHDAAGGRRGAGPIRRRTPNRREP
jgi:rhodanese-related sulfurtransferase/DNA-binding transcriptional ArsR family regulator